MTGAAAEELEVGFASTSLLAEPETWINRRVETVEMLTSEETRRRVSVDFTLPDGASTELSLEGGIAVPIAALTKALRRDFDVRDEQGGSLPALGRRQNGPIAQIAVLSAILDVHPTLSGDALLLVGGEVARIVSGDRDSAEEALAYFAGAASTDPIRAAIWADKTCRRLLELLAENYVLFVVLPPNGQTRRVIKYGYSEDLDLERRPDRRWSLSAVAGRIWRPDRIRFVLDFPGARQAASFHAELVIPDELRIVKAELYDAATDQAVSEADRDINRASLLLTEPTTDESRIAAEVSVAAERMGRPIRAAVSAGVVAALLLVGAAAGRGDPDPGATASLLLAGAAVLSGAYVNRGQHKLVVRLFAAPTRWLALTSLAGLVGASVLALGLPNETVDVVWRAAGFGAALAALRLGWSAARSPN